MTDQELFAMAYMFASVCTRQEEKFSFYKNWTPCPWRWCDCEAAYELIRGRYFNLADAYLDAARQQIVAYKEQRRDTV